MDPDLYVFGPSKSGSLFCTDPDPSFKKYLISKQTLGKNLLFVGILSATNEKSRNRSQIWIRIRKSVDCIRTKMSRIHNTEHSFVTYGRYLVSFGNMLRYLSKVSLQLRLVCIYPFLLRQASIFSFLSCKISTPCMAYSVAEPEP